MKHFNRVCIALACIVGMLIVSLPVYAQETVSDCDTIYISLKENSYQLVTNGTDMRDHVYQIVVPYNAILTIQYSGNKKNNSIFISQGEGGWHQDFQYITSGKSKSAKQTFVVEKGTYHITNCKDNKPVRLKYSIKKIQSQNQSNYRKSKAVILKKNKNLSVLQTFDENYYRWYKIKVTKTQKIRIIGKRTSTVGEINNKAVSVATWTAYGHLLMDYPFGDLFIYDSKGKLVECKNAKDGIITQKAVSKGTYYIRVSCGEVSKGWGDYVTFKWK